MVVEAQLERPVRGSWSVAARCHLGVPTVIESHPLMEDGSPFPTTFWLTCPILVKRASRLEAAGVMTEMTERLARDEALQARLADAVARYRARRDEHLVIKESGGPPGGGPDRVKCLHAHVAHELADPPNPIGALTLASTEWPDCVEPCVVAVQS
ncbi:MAG TPA: DUF501 domain-containing protein [Actinomycetota bacterium]|nr:DUF501 domain-containing protein [Actinomycetota bacterium]